MSDLSRETLFWINAVGDRFEAAWADSERPRIEDYLSDASGVRRSVLLGHLLGVEICRRRAAGESPIPADYAPRFPDDASVIRSAFEIEEESAASSVSHSTTTLPMVPGFQVVRLLGAGTFGEVWLAEDVNLGGRLAALKAVKPRSRAIPQDRARAVALLRKEAGLMAGVRHRNINPVFAWIETDDAPFLVQNYVAGGSLSDRMRRTGALSWRDAARYVADVGEGLSAVHARGIVHRDIKPSNILWDEADDEALLTDFGVATFSTETEGLAGTIPFMAPEAFEGKISPALDVYSLAATLFCLIAGAPPFPASDLSVLRARITKGLPDPDPRCGGLPRSLEEVVRGGLAADPARRPDLAAFLAGLRGALNQAMADGLPRPPIDDERTLPDSLRLSVSRRVGPDRFQPVAAAAPPFDLLTRDMKRVPRPPDRVSLQTGDVVRIEAVSTRAGHLVVFNVGPAGGLNLIHPEDSSRIPHGSPVEADRPIQIGDVEITPPKGRERLFAVWSRSPLALRLDELHDLARSDLATPSPSPLYVATRDMKRVRRAVDRIAPEDWSAVVLELDHH